MTFWLKMVCLMVLWSRPFIQILVISPGLKWRMFLTWVARLTMVGSKVDPTCLMSGLLTLRGIILISPLHSRLELLELPVLLFFLMLTKLNCHAARLTN